MTDWQTIDNELTKWEQPATLWWRDDDAIEDTPALQHIIDHSAQYVIPLHLAVIPEQLKPSLVDKLAECQQIYALQHGVSHQNHARPGQRKIEMGGQQSLDELQAKLTVNRQLLITQFKDNYLDILVPPWNRIEEGVRNLLPDIGYQKLSILGTPQQGSIIPEVNVHIDIIDWKQRCFAGEKYVLDKLLSTLQSQRASGIYHQEPIGLMTHHLQHDQGCSDFLPHFFAACATRTKLQWIGGTTL